MNFTLQRGTTRTLTIPLLKDGSPYALPGGANLIFSLKRRASDDDTLSLVQKALGAGIAISTTNAVVDLLHIDTRDVTPGVYHYDIQAQEADGTVFTAAGPATITITADVTRLTTPSVPIYTTNPGPTTSAEMAAHVAASDPHPQYALESNLGTAATRDVDVPGGVPTLNGSGELVGPIIGRVLLETDTTTVPSLGEQVAIVNSLTTPTRVQGRVGDGVTTLGLRPVDLVAAPVATGNTGSNLGGSGTPGTGTAFATPRVTLVPGNGGANATAGGTGNGGIAGFFSNSSYTLLFIGTGSGGAANGNFSGGGGGWIMTGSTSALFQITSGNGGAAALNADGQFGGSVFAGAGAQLLAVGAGSCGAANTFRGGAGGSVCSQPSSRIFNFLAGNGGGGGTGAVGGNGGNLQPVAGNPVILCRTGDGGIGGAGANSNGGNGGLFSSLRINISSGVGGNGGAGANEPGGTGGNVLQIISAQGGRGGDGGGGVAGAVGGPTGSLLMSGGNAAGAVAGGAGGIINVSGNGINAGGNISTAGGTSFAGGSIDLSDGGNTLTIRGVAGQFGHRVSVPANSAAAGLPGQWASDDSFLYFYGATGWRRIAGSTF